MAPSLLLLMADTILVVHVLFVVFVVFGLLAIYAGYFLRWRWVRNKRFRILHLSAIGYVVVQSWLGAVCPLTTWEMALREEAWHSNLYGILHSVLVAKPALLHGAGVGVCAALYGFW